MRYGMLKTIFVGGAVALIVLFGIDMATSGIERINGPLDGNVITYTQPQGQLQLPENVVTAPLRQLTVADAQHRPLGG